MVRHAVKWPRKLNVTVTEVAEGDGITVSCMTRRSLLAYSIRRRGPEVIARYAEEPSERAALLELAARDPEAAARVVFRD